MMIISEQQETRRNPKLSGPSRFCQWIYSGIAAWCLKLDTKQVDPQDYSQIVNLLLPDGNSYF